MARKKVTQNHTTASAEMAGARSICYGLLVQLFNQLPDDDLLMQIRAGVFEDRFQSFSGVAYLKSYRMQIAAGQRDAILDSLAVDRTRILRGTGPKDLKPPYEGCYKPACDLGSAAATVKCFYRSAGLLPEDNMPESPDYLCVQLDFMKNLCQQEQKLWSRGVDASETIACQRRFLKEHLSSWVGDYCDLVEAHADTDFYRGLALILKGFVAAETDYLDGLSG